MGYRVLLALAIGLSGLCAWGETTPEVKRFDIPEQALSSALLEFSRQSGLNVVVEPALVAGRRGSAVRGEMTAEAVLNRLLAPNGLVSTRTSDNTILVQRPAVRGTPVDTHALQLTQVDSETDPDKRGRKSKDELHESAVAKETADVVVQGQRSTNGDAPRREDGVLPYVVYSAEEIEEAMASTVNEFLLTRLPMNSQLYQMYQYSPGNNLEGNQSTVNMRALGVRETLIMIDGRRAPMLAMVGSFDQPDINTIPLSAVERIEVLPSNAAGLYGSGSSGAAGGAINIILKRKYNDINVNMRYDNTFDTDVGNMRMGGSAGFTLPDGKTQIMLAGSYENSNEMLVRDRPFLQRSLDLILKNNPSYILNPPPLSGPPYPPLGGTANIRSLDYSNLVLRNGNVPLNSSFTHVPYGYAGPASDNGAQLEQNAGKYNMDLPQGFIGAERSQVAALKLSSGYFKVRRSFGERTDALLEYSRSNQRSFAHHATFPDAPLFFPQGHPLNPFQQAIIVRFAPVDYRHGTLTTAETRVDRALAEVTTELSPTWKLVGNFGWSKSASNHWHTGYLNTTLFALMDGSLDPLRDVNAFPNDYSPYYPDSPTSYYRDIPASNGANYGVKVSGPAPFLNLAGGPAGIIAQVERQRDEIDSGVLRQGALYTYQPGAIQQTDSAYLELTLPLISRKKPRRGAQELELQASYRYDRGLARVASSAGPFVLSGPDASHPDIPQLTDREEGGGYTFSARYQPLQSVAVRASYGLGMLVPSTVHLIPQIYTNINPSLLSVFFGPSGPPRDPKRGNTPTFSIQEYRTSGGPQVEPEWRQSLSAGVIFTPAALPGAKLSLDYTHLIKTDMITLVDPQLVMDREALFPDRVRRADLTAADIAAGYTGGAVTYLDASVINTDRLIVRTVDANIDYQWRTSLGTFNANAILTRNVENSQKLTPDSPAYNSIGYLGLMKWRGNAGLTWTREDWTGGWNMQYYDPFFIYGPTASQSGREQAILNQGSATMPRQIYHDLFVKYRMGNTGVLSNSEIQVGIRNIFDKSPPIAALLSGLVYFADGFVPPGDALMRRYSISLSKSFR